MALIPDRALYYVVVLTYIASAYYPMMFWKYMSVILGL